MLRGNNDEIPEMNNKVVKLGIVGCGNFADSSASAVRSQGLVPRRCSGYLPGKEDPLVLPCR